MAAVRRTRVTPPPPGPVHSWLIWRADAAMVRANRVPASPAKPASALPLTDGGGAAQPIPSGCGVYYFETTVVNRGRDCHIGIGAATARPAMIAARVSPRWACRVLHGGRGQDATAWLGEVLVGVPWRRWQHVCQFGHWDQVRPTVHHERRGRHVATMRPRPCVP